MSVQHTTGVPVRRRLVAWSRTPRGRLAGLAGLAVAWVTAYRVNGPLWDGLPYEVFGMDRTARLTETLHFFGYDTVKITLLLAGIIFVVTVLRSSMSVERTRALLGGRREGAGNVLAASLGVVTRSAPAAPCRRSSGSSPPAWPSRSSPAGCWAG
jgi:hypothetical protein